VVQIVVIEENKITACAYNVKLTTFQVLYKYNIIIYSGRYSNM